MGRLQPQARCQPSTQPGWTLLVQGVDLLDERVHALMNQFRFVPDAQAGRRDDQLRH
jgi:ribosomal protein L16 Arg81 hydroxylase